MLKTTRIIFSVSLTSVLIFSPMALVLGAGGPPPIDPTVPVVETGAVSSVMSYSANFAGAVTDPGSETPIERGFQYGTSTDYGSSVSETGSFISGYTYLSQFSGHGEVVTAHPQDIRGMATDSNGNLYMSGRANYNIDKFDSSGNYVDTFSEFGDGDGQVYQPSGIAVDSSNNFYVVDSAHSRVEKFDSNGNYLSQFGSEGTGNGEFTYTSTGPTGIAIDGSGNIYVVDTENNRVQKFNSSGVYQSQFGTAGSGDGEFNAPTYIAVDGSNIFVSDSGNIRVQRFNTSGVYQSQFGTAGSGDGEFDVFQGPQGVAVIGSFLYVADPQNNRVQRFSTLGVYNSEFGTYGQGDGEFDHGPISLAVRGVNIYVSDAVSNQRVQKFTAAGTYVSQIAEFITDPATGLLNDPDAFAQDAAGNVYVADRFNHRVVKFDADGNYVLQFGGEGLGNGDFTQPAGIAVDENGYIYVSDKGSRIQKFNALGVYQSQFGSNGSGDGEFDGDPTKMAFDADGYLYVVDSNANRIEKFNSAGVYQSQFGAPGSGDGEFDSIAGFAFDSGGNIYVADQNNHRIQKFNASGVFQSEVPIVDGTGNGEFNGIDGIAIDADDNFFIIDSGLHRIQKLDPTGAFITKFGTDGSGDGQLSEVHDIGFDALGNVMVLDSRNNGRIEKFSEHSGTYALSATNLACGTLYHYRAFATNDVGTGYGSDATFITGRCPQTSGGKAVAETPANILGSGTCPANLIVSDFMKQGDKNGTYSKYNGKITTQVATLQDHVNRILAVQYNQAAGPKDGKFGPLTKQGVMRLQTALNQILKPIPTLKVDGIVGPFTRDAINHSCRV